MPKATKPIRSIVLLAHNLRSTHNVGSLLRTAEGLGVTGVFLTGYTPYPQAKDDKRLPHLSQKITAQIHKTALGAEASLNWQHASDIEPALAALRKNGYKIIGLEQDKASKPLPDFKPPERLALIVGSEVKGLESEVKALCDGFVEIPMAGQKESFNVVQAAAMALYHCKYYRL